VFSELRNKKEGSKSIKIYNFIDEIPEPDKNLIKELIESLKDESKISITPKRF
jgi:hypothetical protein